MTVNRPVLRVRPPDAEGAGECANGRSKGFSLDMTGSIVRSSEHPTVCRVVQPRQFIYLKNHYIRYKNHYTHTSGSLFLILIL